MVGSKPEAPAPRMNGMFFRFGTRNFEPTARKPAAAACICCMLSGFALSFCTAFSPYLATIAVPATPSPTRKGVACARDRRLGALRDGAGLADGHGAP